MEQTCRELGQEFLAEFLTVVQNILAFGGYTAGFCVKDTFLEGQAALRTNVRGKDV